MDRIQIQASKLWDLLFSKGTADTYQTALTLTGTIIKEFAQLIWLIICSVFVFGAWVGNTAVKTGQSIRDWVDQLGEEGGPSADSKPLSESAKELLDSGRTGIGYLLNQAREQLGLEVVEAAPASKPATATATKNSQSTATAQNTTAPVVPSPPPAAATTQPAPSSQATTPTATNTPPQSTDSTASDASDSE